MAEIRSLRRAAASLARRIPGPLADRLRPIARRVGLAAPQGAWWLRERPPWDAADASERAATAWCNVCRWSGEGFVGGFHSEAAACPQCGSIARDRFLFWCFTTRTPAPGGRRILETSPRLDDSYRTMMRRWFAYRASDYDLGAHRADVKIDLQAIDLPDASVDIVLTPHVLEHVPDTDGALSELFRIIAPGGRMYLQVPLLQGVTAPPAEPEFHADNTPVFWRFGWDLTDRARAAGFTTTVLVPQRYRDQLDRTTPIGPSDVDLESLVEHVRLDDLTVVADASTAQRIGFEPPHHFATWECLRR
jgi:hypothetical protein